MPIHRTQQMTIDLSGRKGLADKFYGDINQFAYSGDLSFGTPQHRYLAKDGQMVSGIFNPLRAYGYLNPSNKTAYDSPVSGDCVLVGSTIYDSRNDKVYALTHITGTANEPRLTRYDGIDATTPQGDRILPAGTTTGGDLEIYEVNGVRTLFYSYNTGSAWRIGIKNLTTDTFTDNWLGSGGAVSGTFEPTSNGEMKMLTSGDGFMYVLNSNAVHRIDGTTIGGANGTITRDVLLAPTYFRFTHGLDHRNNLFIAIQKNTFQETHNPSIFSGSAAQGNYNSDVGVYIWNRQTTFFNTSDFIPIKGARSIRALWINPKNQIMCITQSSNNTTQVRKFNGSAFEVVKELGAFAYPNFEDSLTVVSGFNVWLGIDGNLYYYGSEIPGEEDFLFIMNSFTVTGLGDTLGGAILYAGGNTFSSASGEKDFMENFFINYKNSSNSLATTVRYFPHSSSPLTGGVSTTIAPNTATTFTPVKYLPQLSTVKDIVVYMKRVAVSGTSAVGTIRLYKNNNSTPFMTKNVTNDDIAKGYLAIEVNSANIDALQMSFQWSISSVSDNMFAPSVAIINYENPGSAR